MHPARGGLFTCTEEHNWHLEDGRLLKFTVTIVQEADFPIRYTGFLLDTRRDSDWGRTGGADRPALGRREVGILQSGKRHPRPDSSDRGCPF